MKTLTAVGWVLGSVMLAGSATGQVVLHDFEGLAQFDFLGASVSGAGDVDADGFDDVIVGAYGYNSQGSRAIVFSGATGGVLHDFGVTSIGGVAGAGDIDADGHADLIVGDTGAADLGPNTGRAVVFSGRTGAVLHTFTGSAARDFFGTAVAGAGDVDGDGRPDVIVGAPQSSNPPGPGYARVLSGQSGAVLHQFDGDSAGDSFGYSVDGAGHVDGDARADLIVGAWRADPLAADGGMVRIFSGATGSVLREIDGTSPDDWLGISVAGAGDVNGDGRDDAIVGVPGDDAADNLAGSVRVYSGLNGSLIHVFFGDGEAHMLGGAVDGAGDMDGDGRPDLVAGSGRNYARAWSGSDGSVLFTFSGTANLGESVAGAGSVNGDCFAEVIVGDPVHEGSAGHEVGRAVVLSEVGQAETPFCSGDGSSGPCPCANSGDPGHGCDNSVASGGARLVATGHGCLSADTLQLASSGELPSALTIFLQGDQSIAAVPFGDGLRCIGGALKRLRVENAVGGAAVYPDGAETPIHVRSQNLGDTIPPGATRGYQAYYRDPNLGFCPAPAGSTFNASSGVLVRWGA